MGKIIKLINNRMGLELLAIIIINTYSLPLRPLATVSHCISPITKRACAKNSINCSNSISEIFAAFLSKRKSHSNSQTVPYKCNSRYKFLRVFVIKFVSACSTSIFGSAAVCCLKSQHFLVVNYSFGLQYFTTKGRLPVIGILKIEYSYVAQILHGII